MSYDKEDTCNVDNDTVEESHVRKIKKDTYFVRFLSGGSPVTDCGAQRGRAVGDRATRGRGSVNHGRHPSAEPVTSGSRSASTEGRAENWAVAATGFHGGGSSLPSINGKGASSTDGSRKFGSFPKLNSEKWSKLLTLINNPNSTQTNTLSCMKKLWILDSTCSHHITDRKEFLKFKHHTSIYNWTA
ncbi:hypothetical protein M9H77_17220 [Catharanthus roseus]|uniref:Uncharacterized protein n=1 Tax=Catharanthus roseus TaxID=4058 RepID=A0ACC0B3Z2_CATRO|nr:hypothetical protein M9H77_17220 [Catharanthus roseus]